MIAFLDGLLTTKTQVSAYINVGGVGFEVGMSQQALSQLPEIGQAVTVYTYLQVREDEMSLYGFLSLEEKAMFERLIGVSGVGPKVALAALSYYEPEKLLELIAIQDISAIQKVPGIGKKMASRIILEMKGSLDEGLLSLFNSDGTLFNPAIESAKEALLSMGFTLSECDLALKGAPEGATENTLIAYALKKLGSQ